MKKIIAAALALMLALSSGSVHAQQKKLNIVCTTFPSYDWMRSILGDRLNAVELTLLQDSGADLHNFQPTAQDFIKISSADMMVYIGGPADAWVEDAVKEARNKDMVTVNLLKALGEDTLMDVVKDDHEHDDHDGHVHSHEDEHIWLSLRNAQKLSRAMATALALLDAEHANTYLANQQAYAAQLDKLDRQYREAVDAARHKTLLFGDRFPFRYLAEDYGLTYFAAFSGCSAETEASFETVAFLANKADELNLPAILVLDGSDGKIAKAVLGASRNKSRPLIVLDSMQTVDSQMVREGTTYLGIMEKNLESLKEALK